MNIVLLSGGSGKRLWPMSNEIRSKQFIKIFKDDNGNYESMVQRMYRQIKNIDDSSRIVIATSKNQVSALNNQLGSDIQISVEPCRRDTFPAITLAMTYLHDVLGIDENESVIVCPVDPYVERDYFSALSELEKQVNKDEANLVLMGIEPTYASEKYGYIMPEDVKNISNVSFFIEKPEASVAQKYIEEGALWNSGVFAFKLKYLLNKSHQMIDYSDYYDLFSKYDTVQKISFDYAVVEKEKSIQVMRFNGNWKDLGTWNTLTEAMNNNVIGKSIVNDTCKNVHVINELSIPVLAMGLNDIVVSASPDGILVSDKESSSMIKPYVDKIEQQIMFAEKSWGSYKVIDIERESLTVLITLNEGCRMNYHSHKERNEVWVVIEGNGISCVDGMHQVVKVGDVITMESGCRHTITAETKLKLIEVQLGKEISVHDKQKYQFE